jgi:hypothetical protein
LLFVLVVSCLFYWMLFETGTDCLCLLKTTSVLVCSQNGDIFCLRRMTMCRRLFYLVVVVALMSGTAQAAMVHQWAFNCDNNPGLDSVGGANATLNGAAMTALGQLKLNASAGTYVDLGGPAIGINTYSAFSLVLWSTQYVDQGYTMTAALGGTNAGNAGMRYAAISTSRGDNVSRAMFTRGNDNPGYQSEAAVNWTELNDSIEHQYVLTAGAAPAGFNTANLVLSYYVDGEFIGMLNMGDRTIAGLSNSFAYLGKSLYTGDALWAGNINEFDIYNTALTGAEIQALRPSDVCIPEPATMVLLGFGSLALLRRRK